MGRVHSDPRSFITVVSRLNNTKYAKKLLKSACRMAAAMATVSVFIAGDGGGFHGRRVHHGRGRRGHGHRGHGHGHRGRGRHWWWPP